jgi:acetyl esterase/lipase
VIRLQGLAQNSLPKEQARPFQENGEYIGQKTVIHRTYVTPSFPDVSYAPDTNAYHKMDVYIPAGASSMSPCVICIHGGGWYKGSKGVALPSASLPGQPTYCDSLYSHGYVIADINYRLTQDSVFPAAVFDCKTAVRYLKKHASKYKIDTCRMGIMGGSAGAHLAAFVGTSIGIDSLEGFHLGSRGASSSVQAILDLWGPTDFNYFWNYYPNTPTDSCHPYPDSTNSYYLFPQQWLGTNSLTTAIAKVRIKKANPITYVNGNEPPFGIWHGTDDCVVPPVQSQMLSDALRAKGGSTELYFVPHGNHGITTLFPARDTIRQFFDRHILNPTFSCKLMMGSQALDDIPAVLIYPNPSQGKFRVQVPHLKMTRLEVYNTLGTLVYARIIQENQEEEEIDLECQPRGIYFVRVQTESDAFSRKIILTD